MSQVVTKKVTVVPPKPKPAPPPPPPIYKTKGVAAGSTLGRDKLAAPRDLDPEFLESLSGIDFIAIRKRLTDIAVKTAASNEGVTVSGNGVCNFRGLNARVELAVDKNGQVNLTCNSTSRNLPPQVERFRAAIEEQIVAQSYIAALRILDYQVDVTQSKTGKTTLVAKKADGKNIPMTITPNQAALDFKNFGGTCKQEEANLSTIVGTLGVEEKTITQQNKQGHDEQVTGLSQRARQRGY